MSDLFEEVEEQLRSDRYRALARRGAPWVLALMAAALVVALAVWGWQQYQQQTTDKASEQYAAAMTAQAQGDPAKAQQDVADLIAKISGKPLKPAVIAAAWKQLEFTVDPVPSSLLTGAQHAYQVGVLKEAPKLDGLVDLSLLNQLLKARGKAEIAP